jgi:hypothetical protein
MGTPTSLLAMKRVAAVDTIMKKAMVLEKM